MIEIRFVDGTREWVTETLGDRIVGKDEDGDLLVPLWEGAELYAPLTPCHHASGKGSESPTGVVCRSCYATVDGKYGDSTHMITTAVDSPRYTCTDPECDRCHTQDGGAL